MATYDNKLVDGKGLDQLSKGLYQKLKTEIDAKPNITVEGGKGLTVAKSGDNYTLNVASADEGIIVNEDDIKLNIVNDLITGGVYRPLSAEQGKVLKQLIDTIGTGGTAKLLRRAKALGDFDYIGVLSANDTSIGVGHRLYKPTLYLDGTRIDKNSYNVELNTGLITLNEIYAKYQTTWVVEDNFPYHIRFSYPTLNLLVADESIKSVIVLGDVIEIQGGAEADDGGHRLVKCENTKKLNGVDIGGGRFLNEIPNSRPNEKLDKGAYTGDAQDLKKEVDGKVSKNGDTINGQIVFDLNKIVSDQILIKQNGEIIAGVGYTNGSNGVFLSNVKGNNRVWLYDNGNSTMNAQNLDTNSKEIVSAINEVFKRLYFSTGLDGVRYIQDIGIKHRNYGYIDKTTQKLYLCSPQDINIDEIQDTTVTHNFVLAGSVNLAVANVPAYYSFNLNKRTLLKNMIVNYENYKEVELVIKVEGTYYISSTSWNLQNSNSILVSINNNQIAYAPSSTEYQTPTSVNVVYRCKVGDIIKIQTFQTAYPQSPNFSVFKI